MLRWECLGRFEWADTREQAATLFGADPDCVNFAGYCEKPSSMPALCRRILDPIRRHGILLVWSG